MSTTTIRIQATEGQLQAFERQCQLTELLLAQSLCRRFQIDTTEENLGIVAGWMASARSLGIANHLTSGIKMEHLESQAKPRPTVVCLCGSARYAEQFRSENLHETIAGRIVLSIGCDTKSDTDMLALGELTTEAKARLDELHLRKIDLADEILVLNVDDYIGESTRREIAYARAAGKRVRWWGPTQHSEPGEIAG